MAEIDFDGPEAIFRQLADVLRERIADRTYLPNRKIPSEAGLREEFGVSRTTARAAIKILIDSGLVRPVRGKGVFVTEPPPGED
jgi:DNA-binding GntR family transcriptional regulator